MCREQTEENQMMRNIQRFRERILGHGPVSLLNEPPSDVTIHVLYNYDVYILAGVNIADIIST